MAALPMAMPTVAVAFPCAGWGNSSERKLLVAMEALVACAALIYNFVAAMEAGTRSALDPRPLGMRTGGGEHAEPGIPDDCLVPQPHHVLSPSLSPGCLQGGPLARSNHIVCLTCLHYKLELNELSTAS